MASNAGFILMENAITPELAQKGADAISKGLKSKGQLEKITDYEVPPVSDEIRDAFIKSESNQAALSELVYPNKAPTTVKSTGMCKFNPTNADPTKAKTGRKDDVYVSIALTDLSTENGWFILLEGSHQRTPSSPATWTQRRLSMKKGDAVAWCGGLAYLHTSGGGGMFETLVLI